AQNNWDVNAQNGVPSKGLLQVIQPTFNAYRVTGTANDLTNPVANITAAANYAADRYGSIDNVNSAY
ncbi:transglycosylase SLT domain-containing protein, partial [Streptomyces sp. NPDC002785]|uniref:transglycosylase SLT domain-containing protein n=1 Tax=Streptomyces sp. NPDC002785 TaxID=3154543 RepID=UPI003325C592